MGQLSWVLRLGQTRGEVVSLAKGFPSCLATFGGLDSEQLGKTHTPTPVDRRHLSLHPVTLPFQASFTTAMSC